MKQEEKKFALIVPYSTAEAIKVHFDTGGWIMVELSHEGFKVVFKYARPGSPCFQ